MRQELFFIINYKLYVIYYKFIFFICFKYNIYLKERYINKKIISVLIKADIIRNIKAYYKFIQKGNINI